MEDILQLHSRSRNGVALNPHGSHHEPPESMIGVLAMFWPFGRLMPMVTHTGFGRGPEAGKCISHQSLSVAGLPQQLRGEDRKEVPEIPSCNHRMRAYRPSSSGLSPQSWWCANSTSLPPLRHLLPVFTSRSWSPALISCRMDINN